MSTGRRGLLLSAAFFGLALWLCPAERARAQPPARDPHAGRHEIWNRELSPEQIRQLLSRFGKGDKDAGNALEDAIRDQILKSNPKAGQNKDMDAAIKRMLADKDFMDWALDQAQKHKNQNPGGQKFEITPEMIENLKNRQKNGNGGDPFQLPKFDPKQGPPFDPKQFPNIDPETGFPLDPRTKKPFDPNTGRPVDPKNPPKFNPPDTKVNPADPPPPPMIDPKTGRPVDPPNMEPKRKFDPNNPLGPEKETPEKLAKTKAVETATALWEKNVGPIDESPAVKRAILDLVSDPEAMDALTDSKGNSLFDMFKDAGDNDGLKDLFGGAGKGWEWPKFDLDLKWGKGERNVELPENKPRNRWPDVSVPERRGGSSMGGMGSFDLGGMRIPWILALLFLAAILAVVLWWKWAVFFPPGSAMVLAGGAGPWPLDPRAINTREDVVKAFEYLSVLICGPAAKTWTHSTIADELTALAATHGETAVKLARLYELARYAPLDEPLTRVEIIEARRLVCDLAGVDE